MKRGRLAWTTLALAVGFFPWPCAAQGCRHWTEALAKSFFPRQVDEQALHGFANLSPQQYFQVASQDEEKSFQQDLLASHNAQVRLNAALGRFYQVGSQLYGVGLSSESLSIAPTMDVNAFATGSHVFMNAGLMQYFLKPADYVAETQIGELTPEQYSAIQNSYPWEDDWDSIYFVLAHEASHNLMRHRDKAVLGQVDSMFEDYQQAVTNYRKDVANGRKGGIKRYIWQSMKNFTEELQSAEQQRDKEAEADAVALLLLQRSGFNPEISLVAAEKMDLLLGGGGATGWQAGMTEVLCSTHPGWIERIQKMQTNMNCLQSSGNLCENHVAFPVKNFLSQLHEGMAKLDSYQEETVRIAEGKSSSAQIFQAEVKVEPNDAALQVDGQSVSPGTLHLPVGPHTLSVTKDGYRQQEQQITVFPDVQPSVKIKLKKL